VPLRRRLLLRLIKLLRQGYTIRILLWTFVQSFKASQREAAARDEWARQQTKKDT